MPLDISVLASTVVSAYLLPYVKLGLQNIAEKVTEVTSDSAAREAVILTKTVWEKVKTIFTGDDANRLEQFQQTAGDNKDLIEAILKEKLRSDSSFAIELERLVTSNTTLANTESMGAQIAKAHIAAIVDARGAGFQNARGVKITGVSMRKDTDYYDESKISTEGGTYVAGDVNAKGDFVGRDKNDATSLDS
jgi:hypothetical protein